MGHLISVSDETKDQLKVILEAMKNKGTPVNSVEDALESAIRYIHRRITNGHTSKVVTLEDIQKTRKELQAQLMPILENKIISIVKKHFPQATEVAYSTNAEYNDQDDEYYAAILSVYDKDGNLDLFNVGWWDEHPAQTNRAHHAWDELSEKGQTLVQELEGSISYDDFVLAFGTSCRIRF